MTTVLFLAVCFVAFTNGANANFKGVASLYGSGTTTLRQAAMWGTATTFAGSVAAFSLFLFVLHRRTASVAAFQWVLLPLVAVPISSHFTGEQVTPALLLGGVLVLAGVYLGAIWRSPGPSLGPSPDGNEETLGRG